VNLLRKALTVIGFVVFYLVTTLSYQASPQSLSYLLAAIMLLAFGIFVLQHDPSDPSKRAFLLLTLTIVAYALSVYLSHVASSWGMARVERTVWILRNGNFLGPPALFLLMYRYSESYKRLLRALLWLSLVTMAPFILLNLTGLYVTEYRCLHYTYVPANRLGLYAACAVTTATWLLVASMVQIAIIFRLSAGPVRRQHVLFLVGEIAAMAPSITGFIPAFKGNWFPSSAGALIAIFPICLGIAVLRFNLFGIRVVIRKTLPYALGTMVIGGLFGVSLLGIESLVPVIGELPRGTGWLVFLAIMGVGFQPILEHFRHGLDRLFFRSEAELDRFLADTGPRYRDVDSQAALTRMLAADACKALSVKAAVVLTGKTRVEHVVATPREAELGNVIGLPLPPADVGPVALAEEGGNLELGKSASELADALAEAKIRAAVMFGQDDKRGVLAVAGKRSDLELGPPDLLFLEALVAHVEMAFSSLRARVAANEATALTEALFDVMTNPVALVDSTGRILSVNTAFRSMTGSSAHPTLRELGLDKALDPGAISSPVEIETPQGIFLVSARTVEGPEPEQSILVVMTDMTDLRRLQEADRRRSVLAELGTTISSINHEIVNILSPVNFNLRKLEKACAGGTGEVPLSVVTQRFEALDRVCRDLRAYYKSPSISLRGVALDDLVENILSDLAQTQGAAWVPPSLSGLGLSVLADPQRLRQALLNIIKNAWEAMHDISEKKWNIEASASEDNVVIRITDFGPGIPPDLVKQLFRPFFTTKGDHGTGLGLAVAKKIVEAHGADIAVESRPGKGTTVVLRWPVVG